MDVPHTKSGRVPGLVWLKNSWMRFFSILLAARQKAVEGGHP